MAFRKKTGNLSASEKAYIKANYKKLALDKLCEDMGRHPELVEKYINDLENGEEVAGLFEQDKEPDSLEAQIRSRYYWKTVKKQLLDRTEEDFFVASWCEIVEQFRGDILPTEEQQIKELILSEIYKNRAGEAKVRELKKIQETEQLIAKELKVTPRDDMKLGLLESQLSFAKAAAQQYSQELEKYSKITKDLNKDLKGTRDQRFSKVESGNKTFQSIIKELMEDENREREGREAELMKIAIEKQTKKLYQGHKYEDGMIDSPIYNVDSVKFNEERDEENE